MRPTSSSPAIALVPLLLAMLTGSSWVRPAEQTSSTDQVVDWLEQATRARQERFGGWVSHRRYTVRNEGRQFHRDLDVQMTFDPPYHKHYRVAPEAAKGLLYRLVFKRLLDSEVQHARPGPGQAAALTRRNYDFELETEEWVEGEPCWRVRITPRRESSFLLRGHIWVHCQDHQVVRLKGELARSPSFWTRSVRLERQFHQVGGIWLPRADRSIAQVRVFGETETLVRYDTYTVHPPPATRLPAAGNPPEALTSRPAASTMPLPEGIRPR